MLTSAYMTFELILIWDDSLNLFILALSAPRLISLFIYSNPIIILFHPIFPSIPLLG